jgi:hypothetical protein
MAIKKIKISELPIVQSFVGLFTIGVDALNRSVKVSLEFIKKAADDADSAAAAANQAATNADNAATAANTATANVNTAISSANTAAGNANAAATSANNAATAANAAAAKADTATGGANTAATAANNAATSANAAATSANNAATAATNAATAANAATGNATNAAAEASSAATAANQAAAKADTATTAANNAATAASNAATSATSAASSANQAATSANAAATSATNAATAANTAATSADTATAAASAATAAANTATGNANTAAGNANAAATSANAAATAASNAATAATTAANNANGAADNANAAAQEARGPIEFTEASQLGNIVSGDMTATIFGKLKKWFSSFGSLAWKSRIDYTADIDNLPSIPAPQIQSDYTQTDTAAKDYIKNKPSFKTIFSEAVTGSGNINPKLINDIQYNGATGDLTLKFSDGSANKVINIPVDNFLSEAAYDPQTHVLTLTMQNTEEVEIDLGDLIDEYEAAEDGGLEVVNGNQFKIKDGVMAEITKTPIQREMELIVEKWLGDGDLWAYEVEDEDVAEGCLFEAWPADRVSKQVALHAEIDDNIIVDNDMFTITCAKKPHSDFSIIYTMML